MLKVTVLGSGNFLPDTLRRCSSHLFQTKNENIIFDFGRGAIDALIRKGIHLRQISKIFISHVHSDHLAELGSFLGWLSLDPQLKNTEYNVIIYGPKGIKKSVNHLLKAFDVYYSLKKEYASRLKIIELRNREFVKVRDLKIEAVSVNHAVGYDNINSLAYRIIYKNKIICYSGDTPDCEGIRKACKDADLAIMECTLPKEKKILSHLNGDDLGLIANKQNIKKLVIVHIDKDYLLRVKKDIGKNYSKKITIAKDLMQFKIN